MQLHPCEARLPRDDCSADETIHDAGDVSRLERHWSAELFSWESHRDGRWRLGPAIDAARCLTAGVTDLHPKAGAVRARRLRPAAQRRHRELIRRSVDDHVAGALEVASIDRHVARDQEPRSTRGPDFVQTDEAVAGAPRDVREPFGHGGFGEPIRDSFAARKHQRLSQRGMRRHR
jgi:hypothetical protein